MNIKKILVTVSMTAFLFVLLTLTVHAQNVTFVNDLKVGSENPEVSALQTWLIANGFDIPSISSGKAQKGYFGAQTKVALQKYQKSVTLPSTGFFGPLSRAKLNGTAGASGITPPLFSCPTGYTCKVTPGGTVPPGQQSPNVITTPGVGGTLAVSLQGSPSGASLDKGETEDVVRYKLQAAASDMQVTSIALDFDTRLWLYASSVTIKDDAGATVVTKSNLTQNDFSELTVGSSYRLYIPINYVVPKSQTRYFTVNITMLGISDRSSGTITIGQAQVRSVDGTGVSDTQTVGDDRTFTYTGSNSSQIVMTLNDQSLPNILIPISTTGKTDNVVMGVANFKSQNKDGILRKITIYVQTNGITPSSLFDDIRIQSGNYSYSANSIGNGNDYAETTVIDNMAIPLPKDTNVPIAIVARVKQNTNNTLDGSMSSTTLVGSGTAGGTSNNPVVEDANHNTIDINDANLATSDITFSESDANLFSAAPKTTILSVLKGNINGVSGTIAKTFSLTYTITAGSNTLYVAADPRVALATTSAGYSVTNSTNASSTITASPTVEPSSVAGDASTYYVVPAGGSRTFTWLATLKHEKNTGPAVRTFSVTGIKYGTTSSNLNENTVVYYNYDLLKINTDL